MKWLPIYTAVTTAILLGACANASNRVASVPAAEKTITAADDVSTTDTPLGQIVYNEQVRRRDSMRKVRRTGTRIPRGVCQRSIFSNAYHVPSETNETEDAAIPVPR